MTRKQKKMLVRILAAGALLLAAALLPLDGYWRLLAFLLPYAVIGYDVLWGAVRGIVRGQVFDEDLLMALATVGALCIGEYAEASFVMLFYQVGEFFQAAAVKRSRKSIKALMDIRPDYANIEIDGSLSQVDPDEISIGTIITVLPGEKVPIDGLCGKTDEENLGFTYAELDKYIRTGEIENKAIKELIDKKHKANLFKLQLMPVFDSKVEIKAD